MYRNVRDIINQHICELYITIERGIIQITSSKKYLLTLLMKLFIKNFFYSSLNFFNNNHIASIRETYQLET